MKSRCAKLVSLFAISAMLIVSSACNPQFFTSTNTTAPWVTLTTATGPNGMGVFQGVIAPGNLCIGAIEPDATLIANIDLASTSNRLSIWDGDSDLYRQIDGNNLAWAEARMLDLVQIDGVAASNYANVAFTFDGESTSTPTLRLDLSNLMTDNNQVGRIWTFRILHQDPVDGATVFKTGTSDYMPNDRVFSVRQGVDNDTTAPTIVDFPFADGDTVSTSQSFYITVSKELGSLQAVVVDPKTEAYGDEEFVPLAVTDVEPDGNGNLTYTFYSSRSMATETHYIFIIASRMSTVTPGRAWWSAGMPITQDLTGNLLANNTTYFEAEQDMGAKLGGDNQNIFVYAIDFNTDAN